MWNFKFLLFRSFWTNWSHFLNLGLDKKNSIYFLRIFVKIWFWKEFWIFLLGEKSCKKIQKFYFLENHTWVNKGKSKKVNDPIRLPIRWLFFEIYLFYFSYKISSLAEFSKNLKVSEFLKTYSIWKREGLQDQWSSHVDLLRYSSPKYFAKSPLGRDNDENFCIFRIIKSDVIQERWGQGEWWVPNG